MCRDLLTDISELFDEGENFRFSGRDSRGIQMGVWAGGRMEARPVPAMGGNFVMLRGLPVVSAVYPGLMRAAGGFVTKALATPFSPVCRERP
jgi:hypothetical protein